MEPRRHFAVSRIVHLLVSRAISFYDEKKMKLTALKEGGELKVQAQTTPHQLRISREAGVQEVSMNHQHNSSDQMKRALPGKTRKHVQHHCPELFVVELLQVCQQ